MEKKSYNNKRVRILFPNGTTMICNSIRDAAEICGVSYNHFSTYVNNKHDAKCKIDVEIIEKSEEKVEQPQPA